MSENENNDGPKVLLSEGYEFVPVGEKVPKEYWVLDSSGVMLGTGGNVGVEVRNYNKNDYIRRKPAPKTPTFENVSVTHTKARDKTDGSLMLIEFTPNAVNVRGPGYSDATNYITAMAIYTLPDGRPLTDLAQEGV